MMQYNILKKVLKNNRAWILVLVGVLLFEYLVEQINPDASIKSLAELLILPGDNITTVPAYRSILLIYLTYQLYIYEINNNYIYIFNRISNKKWFINKILLIVIFVFAYSFVYEVIIYCLFNSYVNLSITNMLKNLIFNFLITFIMLNIINVKLLKRYYPFIMILLILILFKHFNFIYYVISIIGLLFLNSFLIFKKHTLKSISE